MKITFDFDLENNPNDIYDYAIFNNAKKLYEVVYALKDYRRNTDKYQGVIDGAIDRVQSFIDEWLSKTNGTFLIEFLIDDIIKYLPELEKSCWIKFDIKASELNEVAAKRNEYRKDGREECFIALENIRQFLESKKDLTFEKFLQKFEDIMENKGGWDAMADIENSEI